MWSEYRTLFVDKESRVDLLNKASPKFFYLAQSSLFERVMLHIARLTDKGEMRGRRNVTIKGLENLVALEIKPAVARSVNEVVQATTFCVDWRNRHIVHIDLPLAFREDAKSLEEATALKVDRALSSLSETINIVAQYYLQTELSFDRAFTTGGALSLLYVLDDGVKAAEKRRERVAKGKYLASDHMARDL